MNNKEEKVTLKEKIKNGYTAFNEKHPKLKSVLVKLGLGTVAAVSGGLIGYTIGHRDGTALANLTEETAEAAADIVEDATDLVESISEAI